MSQDTLSDVLRSVRLRTAVFYYVSCNGRWAAEAPASREIAAAVMPDAEHVIEYHVLTAGECWAGIVGERADQDEARRHRAAHARRRARRLERARHARGPRRSTAISSSAAPSGHSAFTTKTKRAQVDLEGKLPPPSPRTGSRELRLRLHRLRPAAVQSADRDAAALAAPAGRGRQLVERAVRDVCRRRVRRETPRQRSRARAVGRDDVRRRDPAPRRSASRAHDGLARGPARPLRGPRAGARCTSAPRRRGRSTT